MNNHQPLDLQLPTQSFSDSFHPTRLEQQSIKSTTLQIKLVKYKQDTLTLNYNKVWCSYGLSDPSYIQPSTC
eukprot:scaffold1532_cov193-Alexandrium_tamarense.AAC.9